MTVDLRTAAELGLPPCGAAVGRRGRCDLPAGHPVPLIPGMWDHAESIGGAGVDQLANVRRLVEKHGVPPHDGLGVVRSTVAMVEEALIRRPPTG